MKKEEEILETSEDEVGDGEAVVQGKAEHFDGTIHHSTLVTWLCSLKTLGWFGSKRYHSD